MTNSRMIMVLLFVITISAFITQLIIDFSDLNIACACFVLASSFLIFLYIVWTDAIYTHPLSTFTIFGFCFTSQLGAMIAQSATWTPIIYSLRQPLETFSTLALYQAIAILVHMFYRLFFALPKVANSTSIVRGTLEKAGLYQTPAVYNLWIMGAIGAFTLLASRYLSFLDAFTFLTWAPFLIPIFLLQKGDKYCNAKFNYILLVLYTLLIALIGLSITARGIMFSGVITIILIFLLSGMRSSNSLNLSHLLKIGVVGFIGLTLLGPLSDLATAMAIARDKKQFVTTMKTIENTIDNFQNPIALEAYRNKGKLESILSSYDEHYFASPIMARLMETKFHDNALYFATTLTDSGTKDLSKITDDMFVAVLPQPFLDLLKIDIKKENLRFTVGDYLVYLRTGEFLGGNKTGSVFGHGIALFGDFFVLIYMGICLVLFILTDLLSFRVKSGEVAVSTLGMVNIWHFFLYGITAESLRNIFDFTIRGFWQKVLIYLFAFYIAKLLIRLFPNFSHKTKPTARSLSL
jgi:hypothetical protein